MFGGMASPLDTAISEDLIRRENDEFEDRQISKPTPRVVEKDWEPEVDSIILQSQISQSHKKLSLVHSKETIDIAPSQPNALHKRSMALQSATRQGPTIGEMSTEKEALVSSAFRHMDREKYLPWDHLPKCSNTVKETSNTSIDSAGGDWQHTSGSVFNQSGSVKMKPLEYQNALNSPTISSRKDSPCEDIGTAKDVQSLNIGMEDACQSFKGAASLKNRLGGRSKENRSSTIFSQSETKRPCALEHEDSSTYKRDWRILEATTECYETRRSCRNLSRTTLQDIQMRFDCIRNRFVSTHTSMKKEEASSILRRRFNRF